jgi:hypothetical protein
MVFFNNIKSMSAPGMGKTHCPIGPKVRVALFSLLSLNPDFVFECTHKYPMQFRWP